MHVQRIANWHQCNFLKGSATVDCFTKLLAASLSLETEQPWQWLNQSSFLKTTLVSNCHKSSHWPCCHCLYYSSIKNKVA